MTEPIIVRSVTVAEVMDADGALHIEISDEGDPAPWDKLGLLAAGIDAVRFDMNATWAEQAEDE